MSTVTVLAPPITVSSENYQPEPAVKSGSYWCAEENGNGQYWVSAVGDNTNLVLPVHYVTYPGLKLHGCLWYRFVANYSENGGAATQTLNVQLMVDGVATGSVMTTSAIGVFASANNGTFRVDAKLDVLGSMDGVSEQMLEVSMLVLDDTGALKTNDTKYQRLTISNLSSHDIGFKVWKTTASPAGMTTNTLDVRSGFSLHLCSPSVN